MISDRDAQGLAISRRRQPRWRLRALIAGIIIVEALGSVLSGSALSAHITNERTHDIPNPSWGVVTRTYTYTPATAGALNPALLTTRPDLIFLRYVRDYIQLAGAFPCSRDLASYGDLTDPILAQKTRTCPFRRTVTGIVVTQIRVGFVGSEGSIPGAVVNYAITYADGTHWAGQEILGANQSQRYYLSQIHLTCWDSLGITALYS